MNPVPTDPHVFAELIQQPGIGLIHAANSAEMRVYRLARPDGSPFTPEELAATFAKASRSPQPFDVNAGLATEAGAAKFHDRWVNDFGHASVAEGATGHVCIENVSMLAAKAIEDGRLAAYIEASTRYQVWNRHAFACPMELLAPGYASLHDRYLKRCYRLMVAYELLLADVLRGLERAIEKPAHMTAEGFARNLQAKACDICRGMLPAAATTRLSMVANARVFAHALRKLGGHELHEMRTIATDMLQPLQHQFATLIKHHQPTPYDAERKQRLEGLAETLVPRSRNPYYMGASMVFHEPLPLRGAHLTVLAQALYPLTDAPYGEILTKLQRLDEVQVAAAYGAVFEGRGDHDGVPRALEDQPLGFDMLMDFGTWRDLQRHRMTTQFHQLLTPDLGYHTPSEILELGCLGRWQELETRDGVNHGNESVYGELFDTFGPAVAQYVVPMAYRMRALFKFNLRELHHLVELRTRPGGHINYRLAAREMFHEVQRVNPLLVSHLRVSPIAEGDDLKRLKDKP